VTVAGSASTGAAGSQGVILVEHRVNSGEIQAGQS
jgi:hypothetical protein